MANEPQPRSTHPTHSSRSPWQEVPPEPRPALARDMTADVCVIGAGFAGLSAAYFLAKGGRTVVVIDAGTIANGESSATTAHLSAALDDHYFELEKTHGTEVCRLAADAHRWAVDQIETISRNENIACDFARADGFLFKAPEDKDDTLNKELAAARRCGLTVEMVERAPIPDFDSGPALRFARQAQVHPVKYLNGLAAALARLGVTLCGATEAKEIKEGERVRVQTRSGFVVSVQSAVVATNVPFNDRVALQTRLYPYRSYVIAVRLGEAALKPGLFWDTADPYHYVRLHGGLLIVGGEDHKTGQADGAEDRFGKLERWARARFPGLGEVAYRWSGQIIETPDGLGFSGRNPLSRNVYVITGDSGNGTTNGTLGGRIVADAVLGAENPWAAAFSPSRNPAKGAREWLSENLNVAAQYKDHLTPGEVSSVDEIAPGSGAILRRGLGKIAAYKAEDGSVRELSAVCPHLGGIVCWNATEKSWDCPLHGSRFEPTGEVINGPASSGLKTGPRTRARRRRAGRRYSPPTPSRAPGAKPPAA